jgi:large subunit ribosomal protein L2
MGKRIIVQARGHGSLSYRVRKQAYKYRIKYPRDFESEGTVIKLINSTCHTCPIAKIKYQQGTFYMPAFKGMVEGQKIQSDKELKEGNILQLKNIPIKTPIYNIESRPKDGGVFVRTGGTSATISRIIGKNIFVLMPSKQEKQLNPECRATIGVIAGAGRLDKPFVKAGNRFYNRKSRNKLWPRTSAVKMNVIDHPFGSGRGKNFKSKIAKRNVPPGAKVGLLSPRRTGRKKR